jgi:hypothetical protein
LFTHHLPDSSSTEKLVGKPGLCAWSLMWYIDDTFYNIFFIRRSG